MTDRQRFIILMTISIGLICLAIAVALGKVEEKSSYGLTGVLLIVGQLVGGLVKSDRNKGPDKKDDVL